MRPILGSRFVRVSRIACSVPAFKSHSILSPTNICENHCKEVVDSTYLHRYHYGHRMMTVFFSEELNPGVSLTVSVFEGIRSRKIIEFWFIMVLLDVYHLLIAM